MSVSESAENNQSNTCYSDVITHTGMGCAEGDGPHRILEENEEISCTETKYNVNQRCKE